MRSRHDLLVTTTAAASGTARYLTTIQKVKDQLGISGASEDTQIGRWIAAASERCARVCNLAIDESGSIPTLASETLTATWRPLVEGTRSDELLLPWRRPVTSITSVVEDGETLDAADYALEAGNALRRLDGDDYTEWNDGKIVVVFIAGWDVAGGAVPPSIDDAVINQVKTMRAMATRDGTVRSFRVPDVLEETYSVAGGSTLDPSGLIPELLEALGPYMRRQV